MGTPDRELLRVKALASAALSAGWGLLGASQKTAENFWSKYGACSKCLLLWTAFVVVGRLREGRKQHAKARGACLDVEDVPLAGLLSLLGVRILEQLEGDPQGQGLPGAQPEGPWLHLVPL